MARHTGHSAKSVVGIFKDRTAAERAIDSLLNAGFDRDHISVVMRDTKEGKRFADETGTKEAQVGKGAATGAGIGGVLGGAAGVLAGLGAIAIPGIGPLVAAGPIAAGIAGALGGGAVGVIAGGLIGMGIPEDEARRYEEDVKAGNILVAVECENKCDYAKQVLSDSGAINYGRGAEYRERGYGTEQRERTMGGTRPATEEVPHVERDVHPDDERRHPGH